VKIQSIKVVNYKAFLGTHTIKVDGKNLFIYGENGSGKSSLYYALKDFFQSSIEDINLADLENAFVPASKTGKTAIKVTFKPNHQCRNSKKSYLVNKQTNDTRATGDTSIRDGNKLKSFLTYKHLLGIHHLKKDESINLFDLLVKGVLKHFKYPLTKDKELGELWAEVEDSLARTTGKEYSITKKKADVHNAIQAFNEPFIGLFQPESPEYVLRHAKPILDLFHHHIELNLRFAQVRPSHDYARHEGAKVHVDLRYAGKPVEKPHLFLNEARLSAIAISIYLGMIKRHVQGIPCKVLFLDDIFIGLDIANRLPLLEILKTDFPDYQIFITTYDKPWFEYARGFLEGQSGWKTLEFYAQPCGDGTEVPIIFDDQDLIVKANRYLQQCDYKAAAVYTRSAFEKEIRKYCEKKKKAVVFKSRLKDYTSEDFWKVIKADVPQSAQGIEQYRALVLNPFSHYNTERHEIKTELENAIAAVKTLRDELTSSLLTQHQSSP
jgi:energy-coupling factor transporter ATP-binding protein EcfA2